MTTPIYLSHILDSLCIFFEQYTIYPDCWMSSRTFLQALRTVPLWSTQEPLFPLQYLMVVGLL